MSNSLCSGLLKHQFFSSSRSFNSPISPMSKVDGGLGYLDMGLKACHLRYWVSRSIMLDCDNWSRATLWVFDI